MSDPPKGPKVIQALRFHLNPKGALNSVKVGWFGAFGLSGLQAQDVSIQTKQHCRNCLGSYGLLRVPRLGASEFRA